MIIFIITLSFDDIIITPISLLGDGSFFGLGREKGECYDG